MKKILLNVSITVGLLAPMQSAKAELHEIREFYNKASGVVSRLAAKDKLPLYQELIAGLETIKDGDKNFTRLGKDEKTTDVTVSKGDRQKLVEFVVAAKALRQKVGDQCKEDESTKGFWKIMDNCIAIGMGETFLTSEKRVARQDREITIVEKFTGQCFYEMNDFLEAKDKKVKLGTLEKTFSEKLKETARILLSKDLEKFQPEEESTAKKTLGRLENDKVCKLEDKKPESEREKISKEESDKSKKDEKDKKDKEEQESKSIKPAFNQVGSPATGRLADPGAGSGQPTPPPGTGTPGPGGAGPAFPPAGFQPLPGAFDPSSLAGQNPFDALGLQNPFLQQPPLIDQSQRRDGDRTGGNRTENPPQQQQFIPPPQDNSNNDRQDPLPPEPQQPVPQQAPIPVGNQSSQGMDPMMLAMLKQMMDNNNRPQAAPLAPALSQDAILAKAKADAEERAKQLAQSIPFYGPQQMMGGVPMTGVGPLLGGAVGSRPFSKLNQMASKVKKSFQTFMGTGKNNLNYINAPRPAPSSEGIRGGLGKYN